MTQLVLVVAAVLQARTIIDTAKQLLQHLLVPFKGRQAMLTASLCRVETAMHKEGRLV
jgi:hypothetical protein